MNPARGQRVNGKLTPSHANDLKPADYSNCPLIFSGMRAAGVQSMSHNSWLVLRGLMCRTEELGTVMGWLEVKPSREGRQQERRSEQ